MTHHHHSKPKQSLRDLLAAMSLDELREGKRLLQSELDQRTGKRKFQPVMTWPFLMTRDDG